MRAKMTALTVAFLTLAAPAHSQRIAGAFVVLHKLPSVAELTRAREDGLNLVILQYSRGSEGPVEEARTLEFMRRAESARLDYMLGLHYSDEWESEWLAGASIEGYVLSNLETMKHFEGRTTPRFRGWYMPLEVGNYKKGDYAALETAFAKFRGASASPIAISVYFNPDSGFLRAEEFARRVAPVLAPFDFVLMQDGVGERSITDFPLDLEPYYRALSEVVTADGRRQFWSTVEGFECAGMVDQRQCREPRSPAEPARIRKQVITACGFTSQVVAYDLVEFLKPRGSGSKRRAYNAYMTAVSAPACRTRAG